MQTREIQRSLVYLNALTSAALVHRVGGARGGSCREVGVLDVCAVLRNGAAGHDEQTTDSKAGMTSLHLQLGPKLCAPSRK